MSVRLQMTGLAELRDGLRRLPQELTEEAQVIVESQAGYAEHQIEQAYNEGPTGNLRRGVTRSLERNRFSTRAIVRSRAPHASMWERGTGSRRTSRGWNRGRMPQAPESKRMIPIVIRRRRIMVEALKNLVRRAGFQVD